MFTRLYNVLAYLYYHVSYSVRRNIGHAKNIGCVFNVGQNPASFCIVPFLNTITNIVQSSTINGKKRRWWAWDSNSALLDCRCRRIHLAMLAPHRICYYFTFLLQQKKLVHWFIRRHRVGDLYSPTPLYI